VPAGEHEGGGLDPYVTRRHAVGPADVRAALIEGAGHFAAEDAPSKVWDDLADFIADTN